MSDDSDRAAQVADGILLAPPGAEYTAAYAIAGLTLAVLHVGDEVSRLADAVEQYLKHAKGV